jgi:hypothetical protein
MEIKCKYCGEMAEEDTFPKACVVNGKTYRRRRCLSCYGKTKNKRNQDKREWLDDLKKTMKCVRCGIGDFRCLQFHHPEDDKDHNIANMMGHSKEKIIEEISKCEVLCGNCHLIEHWNLRNDK